MPGLFLGWFGPLFLIYAAGILFYVSSCTKIDTSMSLVLAGFGFIALIMAIWFNLIWWSFRKEPKTTGLGKG